MTYEAGTDISACALKWRRRRRRRRSPHGDCAITVLHIMELIFYAFNHDFCSFSEFI
jgi:hypothetical protein